MTDYYRNVPTEIREKFMRFRQEHPLQKLTLGGIQWETILSGDPQRQPLLLLPGGLGTAESAWRMIIQLDERPYRLICPSYPAELGTMTALADGIAELLTKEGIATTYVAGSAYGSMLAQVFIHRHADRVSKLVLTHAYPPEGSRIRSVEPTLKLLRWVPMFMVKNILRTQMTGRLPPNPAPELLLIAAQIRETLDTQLTRQAALNTYQRLVDFDQQIFTYTDLEGWYGQTLIILAEEDLTTTEDLRNTMFALYPGASMYMFKGSSKSTVLIESGELLRVMEDFFAERPIA
jgi:pimeloyl-ACP methyl ester carboxylesterase